MKDQITISTLGPSGTFSYIATEKFIKKNKLNGKIFLHSTIYDVFENVRNGKAEMGVVPIENSVDGSVRITLDELFVSNLSIGASFILPIKHCFAVHPKTKEIKEILSNSHPLMQCHEFIKKNYSKARLVECYSTAQAMQKISKGNKKFAAAIGPKETATAFGLKVLEKDVQDSEKNTTKFITITSLKNSVGEKTSIALYGHTDRAGLLYDLLGVFAKRKINLTKIESRPAKEKLGQYIFYIDFEGSLNEKKVKNTLEAIKKQGFKIKSFGSYNEI